jgi:hypothetical protein
LLSEADTPLSISGRAEVQHFVDVGEYGPALETAVDIFVEEGKTPDAETLGLLTQLARNLAFDPNALLAPLDS